MKRFIVNWGRNETKEKYNNYWSSSITDFFLLFYSLNFFYKEIKIKKNATMQLCITIDVHMVLFAILESFFFFVQLMMLQIDNRFKQITDIFLFLFSKCTYMPIRRIHVNLLSGRKSMVQRFRKSMVKFELRCGWSQQLLKSS